MVRMLGLALTGLLVAFQLWYGNATPRQREIVPDFVRLGANAATHTALVATDEVGDAVGPRFRRGWRKTRLALGLEAAPRRPREGFMAAGEDLSGQSFATRRLDEATFLGAVLDGADFTKAFVIRSMLDGAHAQGALFDEAVLERSSARAADFSEASFRGADLSRATMQGAHFSGADLSGAELSRAQLSAARFADATLRGANARDAVFFRAHLDRADLSAADFSRANLEAVSLRGATLDGTILEGAKLHGAVLSAADLSGALGLTQRSLEGACGDGRTRLPAGLHLPPCASQLAADTGG